MPIPQMLNPDDNDFSPFDWISEMTTPEPEEKKGMTCSCEIRDLANFGCKCGYIEWERGNR